MVSLRIMTPAWSQDAYLDALAFAAAAHRGQTVPASDLPYVVHLASVAQEVMAALAREPVADGTLAVVTAVLHDVIEDTATPPDAVGARFGPEVLAGVLALSKRETLPKAERMADSLRRIRERPREVWMVKLADRIVNLGPPPAPWSKDKIRDYHAEAGQILDALHPASAFLAGRFRGRMAGYAAHF